MPCTAEDVFAHLPDDSQRLEWDKQLKEARLTRGCTIVKKGATSLCVGKPFFGMIGIETRYLTFTPGVVAAVEMINAPPFLAHFAASIRHQNTEKGSLLTYRFQFTARPRWLRWLFHPLRRIAWAYETKRRLEALV